MFGSIKSWLNLPATIIPFDRRTGTGAKIFGAPVDIKCYAEGSMKVVTNAAGSEIVSSKQLYVDGTVEVKELDNIIFEGVERPVQAISTYYMNGVPNVKVVYL